MNFVVDYKTLMNKDIADILIVTATDVETQMLHASLSPIADEGLLEINHEGRVYYAGRLGEYNVVHCQCTNMGTQERGASLMTTTKAISAWPRIKAVVMVGIAFGMYENEGDNPQHYSDVLIANTFFPYETQRLNPDDTVEYRGREHFAESKFIDAFAVIAQNWKRQNLNRETTKIDICPMLSGEKLVDNLEERNILKSRFSTYRGGEMEGMGVASACEEYGKPWILLKAICDFADGNKKVGKKEKQRDAAEAAVLACKEALATDNVAMLIGEKVNYYYRPEKVDLSKIFFIHYDDACEPYYLQRSVDDELAPFILKKSCWVYGKSGMGKSELLTRTLVHNGLNYIYVDLSLCSKTDTLDSFRTMYDEICNKVGVEPIDVSDFRSVINLTADLLNTHFGNQTLYLLLDEIPFEHKSAVFNEFVGNFCAMMTYCGKKLTNTSVLFMLSSIASPLKLLSPDYIDKMSQHVKFEELKDWTMEECRELINLLNTHVHLEWKDVNIDDFALDFDCSPRSIKNALNDVCVLGCGTIDKTIVNRIKLG